CCCARSRAGSTPTATTCCGAWRTAPALSCARRSSSPPQPCGRRREAIMSDHDLSTLGGYLSALPTPFIAGRIDEAAFETLCDWQIREGIAGGGVCGTPGETPTLSDEEQRRLVHRAVRTTAGRVPVIAGAGANATQHAIELARTAEAEGADGILAVVPYYN